MPKERKKRGQPINSCPPDIHTPQEIPEYHCITAAQGIMERIDRNAKGGSASEQTDRQESGSFGKDGIRWSGPPPGIAHRIADIPSVHNQPDTSISILHGDRSPPPYYSRQKRFLNEKRPAFPVGERQTTPPKIRRRNAPTGKLS